MIFGMSINQWSIYIIKREVSQRVSPMIKNWNVVGVQKNLS
jgi:hypothetical protein